MTSTKRGAQSNVRAGESFEAVFTAALAGCADIELARCHPATKMVPDKRVGSRIIYTAKNGVDFVGGVAGRAVALELKRLPNASSLSGAKDDSTQAEAMFLRRFARAGNAGGFLILDPERDRLYVVDAAACEPIAVGQAMTLRTRDGVPCVPCYELGGPPVKFVEGIRAAVRAIAAGRA